MKYILARWSNRDSTTKSSESRYYSSKIIKVRSILHIWSRDVSLQGLQGIGGLTSEMDNMDPDAIEYITTRKHSRRHMFQPLTSLIETSQLNVQESIPQPLPVLDYDAVSPPVQSIFSAGVIAVDITEHFVKAAGRMVLPYNGNQLDSCWSEYRARSRWAN